MSSRILCDPTKPHGKMTVELADLLLRADAKMQRLRAAIERMASVTSGAPTYTQIETELGLQAGDGIVILNLLADAYTKLSDPAIKAFTERVDQG
jgi:hypothetical protein